MSLSPTVPALIARAQAARLFRSVPTLALSDPAPDASAPAPPQPPCSERSLETWIAEKLISLNTLKPVEAGFHSGVDPGPELHLHNETRIYIMGRVKHCPLCGGLATLLRSYLTGRPRYLVKCSAPACGHATPWINDSRAAVRAWETYAMMCKG